MVQWFKNNIFELNMILGLDLRKFIVSGQLFLPTADGIRGPVPVGSYILKHNDVFEIITK